jgi:hypothetical protein
MSGWFASSRVIGAIFMKFGRAPAIIISFIGQRAPVPDLGGARTGRRAWRGRDYRRDGTIAQSAVPRTAGPGSIERQAVGIPERRLSRRILGQNVRSKVWKPANFETKYQLIR